MDDRSLPGRREAIRFFGAAVGEAICSRTFFRFRERFFFRADLVAAGRPQLTRNFPQLARNSPQLARNLEIRMCSVFSRAEIRFHERFLV